MPHAIDPPDAATVDVSATTDEGMGMIRVTTSTVSFESTFESGSNSQASIAPDQGMSLRFLDDNSLTEMLSRADLTTADRERYNRALANVDILEGFGSSGGVYERGHLVLALLALMRYVESCEGRGLRLRHRPDGSPEQFHISFTGIQQLANGTWVPFEQICFYLPGLPGTVVDSYEVSSNPSLTLATMLLIRGLYALEGHGALSDPGEIEVTTPLAPFHPPGLLCIQIPEDAELPGVVRF